MSILQELSAKPWLPGQSEIDDRFRGSSPVASQKQTALRVFLAVVTMLFLLLLMAYAGRMGYEDWRAVPQPKLLWANTVVLVLASIAMQLARGALARRRFDAMRVALLSGGAFTLVFLFGQLLAWRQLAAAIYFDLGNPAIGFFYLITGLHGLHLLGGLVAWGRTAARVWRDDFNLTRIGQSVGLCAVYWHFLLLVWLVLFGLLFAGNNFELLLKLCGIR